MERILICRDELILTGNILYMRSFRTTGGSVLVHGILVFVKACFCITAFIYIFAKFIQRIFYLWLSHLDVWTFLLCSVLTNFKIRE